MVYLGSITTEGGKSEVEIKRGIARNAFNNMKCVLSSRNISINTRMRLTYNWTNFLKNRIIVLLEDKLLHDFYHGFFWSEENVVLNYFPTQDGVWVLVCPLILIIGRCYCHYVCEMVIAHCNYCLLLLSKVAGVIAIIVCGRW